MDGLHKGDIKTLLMLLISLIIVLMGCGYIEDGKWIQGFICIGIMASIAIAMRTLDKGDEEMRVNIDDFLKQFEKNYDFLYNAKGYVVGYDEALEFGDKFIKQHPEFVSEFCKYRGDLLSSDREVASFAFTLDDMDLI